MPSNIKKFLILTFLSSILTGGIVGGVCGIIFGGWAIGGLWPNISSAFGVGSSFYSQENQGAFSKVVVEDSATVDVVEKASPAVVSIVITQDLSEYYNRTGPMFPFDEYFFFGYPFNYKSPSGKMKIGGGTGFIITTDGMIVTNKHVVESDSASYTVLLNDGTQYEAKVIARDDINDIAIIKIDSDNLPVLDMGDSDQIKIGQTVIAIGNTLGEYKNTVTKGVVSGINRRVTAGVSYGYSEVIEEAIQTDAAINPGNSGGPLLDLFGKVIGVNTAVSQEGQLIGFAIPINLVKNVIESVQRYGRIVRPFLGVRYILLNKEIAQANEIKDIEYGALIVRGESRTDLAIMPGSPADKAGIVENDIILEVNGEKIDEQNGLARIISKYNPSDEVNLKVYHKGEEKNIKVILEEKK